MWPRSLEGTLAFLFKIYIVRRAWITSSGRPVHNLPPLSLLPFALTSPLWSGCALSALFLRWDYALANFILLSVLGGSGRCLLTLHDVSMVHPRSVGFVPFSVLAFPAVLGFASAYSATQRSDLDIRHLAVAAWFLLWLGPLAFFPRNQVARNMATLTHYLVACRRGHGDHVNCKLVSVIGRLLSSRACTEVENLSPPPSSRRFLRQTRPSLRALRKCTR